MSEDSNVEQEIQDKGLDALGGRTSLDRAAPRQPGEAPPWYVTDDKPWFAYCPEQGLMACGTEAEAIERATDMIDNWLDGDAGWDEQVDQVFVGRATQISGQVDRVDRPDESQLDEDGCDPEGYYWGDYEYVCNYKVQPVISDAAKLRTMAMNDNCPWRNRLDELLYQLAETIPNLNEPDYYKNELIDRLNELRRQAEGDAQ